MKKKSSKERSASPDAKRKTESFVKSTTARSKGKEEKEDFEFLRDEWLGDSEKRVEGRVTFHYSAGWNERAGENYIVITVEGGSGGIYSINNAESDSLTSLWSRFKDPRKRNAFFRDKLLQALDEQGEGILEVILRVTAPSFYDEYGKLKSTPSSEPLKQEDGFNFYGERGRPSEDVLFWQEFGQAAAQLKAKGSRLTQENLAARMGTSARALQGKCRVFSFDEHGRHFAKALKKLEINKPE